MFKNRFVCDALRKELKYLTDCVFNFPWFQRHAALQARLISRRQVYESDIRASSSDNSQVVAQAITTFKDPRYDVDVESMAYFSDIH